MQHCHSFNWEDTNVLKIKKKKIGKTEYVDKKKELTQHYPREQNKAVQVVLTNPTLKLQIRIDFKWNRKVVLAVKGS